MDTFYITFLPMYHSITYGKQFLLRWNSKLGAFVIIPSINEWTTNLCIFMALRYYKKSS